MRDYIGYVWAHTPVRPFIIGEFSKIARTSIRQLLYYDEIDLFKPSHTDTEIGYRYYHAKQLPQLNRILVLIEYRRTFSSHIVAQGIVGA